MVASVFNAPFAGIFFAMEILLRDFSLRTFTPVVIAAVISSGWTRGLLELMHVANANEALFGVGPEYFTNQAHFTVLQILNYLALGLLCGIAAATFTRGLTFSEHLLDKLKAPTILKPAIGAAVLGGFGLAYVLIIRQPLPHGGPEFYGNGYPIIKEMVRPGSYFATDPASGVATLQPPLLELSEQHLVRDFVVVDRSNRYIGMVTGNDLAAALVYREAIPLLQVHELLRTDLPTVTPDETLDVAMDKFSTHDSHSLAVLDGSGERIVQAVITRSRLMERYQAALEE